MSDPDADFSFGASAATTPTVIASSGAATAASGLYFGDPPSSSVMLLPNQGAEARAQASEPAVFLGVASSLFAATPAPLRLSPRHRPRPSHLALEFPNHAEEAAEHPDRLPKIVHHHI